jgi:hypothetical protein
MVAERPPFTSVSPLEEHPSQRDAAPARFAIMAPASRRKAAASVYSIGSACTATPPRGLRMTNSSSSAGSVVQISIM